MKKKPTTIEHKTFQRSATFSSCGKYRYTLSRDLEGDKKGLVFILLNPSKADEVQDDPTIRRCIYFANREKAQSLTVLNLFAYRATKPKDLFRQCEGAFGPLNRETIGSYFHCKDYFKFVAAWGANGGFLAQGLRVVLTAEKLGVPLYCLGQTKNGNPHHPLYIPNNTKLTRYFGEKMRGLEMQSEGFVTRKRPASK